MADVTSTIGTATRDYTTHILWEADLDEVAIYSSGDVAIGETYDDAAFTDGVVINGGGTVGLLSRLLTVASGERHDGTAGTGARFVMDNNSDLVDMQIAPTTVEWLEVDEAGFSTSRAIDMGAADADNLLRTTKLIVHGIVRASALDGILLASGLTDCMNCIAYNMESTHTGTGISRGIRNGSTATQNILNCTSHNIKNNNGSGACSCIQLIDTANTTIQNNIATDPSGDTSGAIQCYNDDVIANATVDHNLASDTTAAGTGSLDSRASGDQFVSNVEDSEDLHLKAGADAIDAGVDLVATPTDVEIDIDNFDRNAGGGAWDMGCHEFIAAAAIPVPEMMAARQISGLQPIQIPTAVVGY